MRVQNRNKTKKKKKRNKKKRNAAGGGASGAPAQREDRFSSLPDDMIAEILSRIPLKTAVTTDVLSRRMRGLWTQINHTDIDLNTNLSGYEEYVFNEVLPQMPNVSVRRFSLDIGSSSIKGSLVEPWFRQICDRNVQEIHVHDTLEYCSFWLRRGVLRFAFQSPTLVVLELGPGLIIDSDDTDKTIDLPNLKKLSLCKLHGWSDCDLLQKFTTSCPLLEELFVEEINYKRKSSPVEISGKNLKKLYMHKIKIEIVIDAPKLQHLTLCDEKLVGFKDTFSNSTNVEGIFIECPLVFLRGYSSIRSLKVDHMPRLFGAFGPSTMVPTSKQRDVLKFCSSLEVLALKLSGSDQCYFRLPSSEHAYRLTNVKRIEIEAWHGLQLDKKLLRMVRYLLTSTPVLERFTFKKAELQGYARKGMEPFKFWSDIRALPRGSLLCQFDFSIKYLKSLKDPFI